MGAEHGDPRQRLPQDFLDGVLLLDARDARMIGRGRRVVDDEGWLWRRRERRGERRGLGTSRSSISFSSPDVPWT